MTCRATRTSIDAGFSRIKQIGKRYLISSQVTRSSLVVIKNGAFFIQSFANLEMKGLFTYTQCAIRARSERERFA